MLLVSGSQEFFAERAIGRAVAAWRAAGFEIHEVSGKSPEVAADIVMSASPDLFGAAPVILLRQAEALDDPAAAKVCDTIAANPDTAWIIWHAGGRGSPKAKARLSKAAGQTIAAGNLAINLHNHEVLLRGEPVRLTPVEFNAKAKELAGLLAGSRLQVLEGAGHRPGRAPAERG